jgi:hypothetical protein
LKGLLTVKCYRISPHVFIEFFADDAVMLVADQDLMVTVNHAAAKLFEQASLQSAGRSFRRTDWVNFLLQNFQLDQSDAEWQTRSILGFALRHGLVEQRTQDNLLLEESLCQTAD